METISRLVLGFLLNALWQVALVAGVAALGARMLRNGPARYRHALWVMALGMSVLLPLSTLPGSLRGHRQRWAGLEINEAPSAVTMLPPAPSAASVLPPPRVAPRLTDYFSRRDWPVEFSPWLAYAVLGCYWLFLLFRIARLCRAWRRTDEVRRSAQTRPLPAWMASSVWRCQVALGLGHVSILCSSRVTGPVTLGAHEPLIILPASMLEGSSAEDLASTLCHEMAHIRRHDFLMNLLYELLYLLISFHPAGALIKRRIDQTRELTCDEMAAGRLPSTSAYARSLVNLSGRAAGLPSPAGADYTLGVFDANILEERVMRLLDKRPRSSARLAQLILAAVLSALALVGMGATMFSLSVKESSQTDRSHPDFSGHWNLDKTRSMLPPQSPEDLVQAVDHRDPQLKITTTSKDWSAEFGLNIQRPIPLTLFALTIPEWVTTTDGIERSEKYGPAELKSKTRWEGDRLITAWSLERDGQVEIAGEWVRSLSADGRTQTVEVKAHDPQRGGKGEAKLVFMKSSGNTADSFVGTWQAEFQGKTFIVVELRTQDHKLTGTVSPFTIELDKAGNLTKAERGDHGGWDVVEAALDQNGFALKCKDRETGDIDRFQMRLIGENEVLLTPMGAPAPPAGPQPFKLQRGSAPEVGVSGGVRGGVGDGVRGGVVGAVSQSVKSDPPEGGPSISGTVFDPSGARVPHAVVKVMSDFSVVKRTTVTNDEGGFAFAMLPPDLYQLEVMRAGFALYRERIGVRAGAPVSQLSVVLQPGSIMQSMEVVERAAPGTRGASESTFPHRIRVGGQVETAKLVENRRPDYPESARLRGIEGAVLLEAVISMDGIPLNLKVLSSPDPDLSEAAIDAVRQWRYEPTLLNGEPIEVVTTISVRFRLEDTVTPGQGR